MWARRLIYTLLAMLPVMFTAAIAVGTRLTPMDWSTPEFGAKTNEALLKYSSLVSLTETESPASMHPDPGPAFRIAHVWVDSELPPLSAGNMPASGLDGPFYEVQRARQLLCMNLLRVAQSQEQQGYWDDAGHTYSLMVRLAEVAKYSSLNSINTSSDCQREALRHIDRIAPHLAKATQEELVAALGEVTVRPETVSLSAEKLMDATRDLLATTNSLKRYAQATMTTAALTSTPRQTRAAELTSDELSVIGLDEAAQTATKDLGDRKAEALRKLAPKG